MSGFLNETVEARYWTEEYITRRKEGKRGYDTGGEWEGEKEDVWGAFGGKKKKKKKKKRTNRAFETWRHP